METLDMKAEEFRKAQSEAQNDYFKAFHAWKAVGQAFGKSTPEWFKVRENWEVAKMRLKSFDPFYEMSPVLDRPACFSEVA